VAGKKAKKTGHRQLNRGCGNRSVGRARS
jgi:hypothetical protein